MSEGIRFDLAYETMPWHKVDAVVFDDTAPKAVFLHGDAPCSGAKTAL